MTKQEAKDALLKGEKVTHIYFTKDEYVRMINDEVYEFEDGCCISSYIFWQVRENECWETGWEIV